MTGTTTWAEAREQFTRAYGTAPNAHDDQAIGSAFTIHPAAVLAELHRVADLAGINHPWRLVASKLAKITRDNEPVGITADLRTRQAEAWIRNAGIYVPDEAEVRNELFHATGALLTGLEDELGDRMVALWRREQPGGERGDLEFLRRQDAYRVPRGLPPLAPVFGSET